MTCIMWNDFAALQLVAAGASSTAAAKPCSCRCAQVSDAIGGKTFEQTPQFNVTLLRDTPPEAEMQWGGTSPHRSVCLQHSRKAPLSLSTLQAPSCMPALIKLAQPCEKTAASS